MTLIHPLSLLWELLAVPIVLLYLRRTVATRRETATDWLWQQAWAEESRRAAWMRWREKVSLACQLLVLTLIVLALADPRVGAGSRGIAVGPWLLGASIVLLSAQWCLYQRRWMS